MPVKLSLIVFKRSCYTVLLVLCRQVRKDNDKVSACEKEKYAGAFQSKIVLLPRL